MMSDNPTNRILNCVPSNNTHTDWSYEHANEANILNTNVEIPQAVDLREAWWQISNQGTTGACVGWALADSVLRWYFVKAQRLNKDELLSARYIWMAAKEGDEYIAQPTTFIETAGTSLKTALDVVRIFGVVRESVLPFNTGHLFQGSRQAFYALAAQLKISSYFNLGLNINAWRLWLATQGPILARLKVDDNWYNAAKTKGYLDHFQPTTEAGGHAIAIVGYTPDRFIIRNSWGTEWGDQGYVYISLSYIQDAFTEAYGVTI